MLNSLQNGRCSFIFTTLVVETTNAATLIRKQFFFFSQVFLFHPYLFTKSSLQFPLTLPSCITQQLFTSLFLRTTILTIYTKNIFPTSNILPIQAASRYQEVREYWGLALFNFSLLPQSMDSDCRAHSQSLILYHSDSKDWYIAGVASHPNHLLSYLQPIFITFIVS